MDLICLNGLGERLFILRREKRISQEKIALETGIKIDTYRSIETGRRIGRVDTLVILSDYFGVTLDYLVCGRNIIMNEIIFQISILSEEKQQKIYNILIAIVHNL